jgi:hypothetical protein
MKKFRIKGPGGEWMETTAPSEAKARSNFRWRLQRHPYGMSPSQAREWAATGLERAP